MKIRIVAWGLVGALALAIAWFAKRPPSPGGSVGPQLELSGQVPSTPIGLSEPPPPGGPTPIAAESRTLEESTPPTPDEWAAYEASSVDDLEIELARLTSSLKAETTPLFFEQVRRGQAERIAEPGEFTYHSRPEDKTDIHGIVSDPELGVFRACLPRSQYADLYEVKSRILNLDALISSKKRSAR